METTKGYIGIIFGVRYRDNGKENGNNYILYAYIGVIYGIFGKYGIYGVERRKRSNTAI